MPHQWCDNSGMQNQRIRKTSTLTTLWLVLLLIGITSCKRAGNFGPAPVFTLQTESGEAKGLKDYGVGSPENIGENYLLINFWASWCKPCIQEIPLLKEFARQHEGEFTVLGIAADRISPAQAFAKRLEIDYPVLYGEYEQLDQVMQDYGNTGQVLPYTVLVSPSGQIIWRHTGLLRLRDLQKLPR